MTGRLIGGRSRIGTVIGGNEITGTTIGGTEIAGTDTAGRVICGAPGTVGSGVRAGASGDRDRARLRASRRLRVPSPPGSSMAGGQRRSGRPVAFRRCRAWR